MEVLEEVGGTPYIRFKSNTVIPKDDSIWARMYRLLMFNREDSMTHYHQRSDVESVFSMIKGKLGASSVTRLKPRATWGR